mmetsp:Transcript_45645/g.89202  ORF Transcript_45645/g.89202 Transcript_45645/m.89202 type:complete len:154 (+) Transcript_45645:286-747(+)
MADHLHRRGLSRGLFLELFEHEPEAHSPTLLLKKYGNATKKSLALGIFLPPTCVIHGKEDQTVPYREAVEFTASLRGAGVAAVSSKLYDGWSHTDPILEGPMDGDQRLHRDIYELVKLWTNCSTLPAFDDDTLHCRPICPHFLIKGGRVLNPF